MKISVSGNGAAAQIVLHPSKGKSMLRVDSVTLADNYVIIIEEPMRSDKTKRAVVNSLIDAMWSSEKARKKRRLRIVWTCSDHVHHEHRWRWTAWVCGRIQYWWARK